jgi:V8-like Glu-specific endopeptidase
MALARAAVAAAVAVAVAAAGGCAVEDAAIASSAAPIIGGEPDPGSPAVVFVSLPGGIACSGSLIGRRVVLTAAHCVEPIIREDDRGGTVYIGAGGEDEWAARIRIAKLAMHRYYDPRNVRDYDIGLIGLSEEAPPEIPLLPFNLDPLPASLVGQQVRVVGYGVTDGEAQTGAGTKREVTLTVDSIDEVHVGLGDEDQNICQGDSGGPTLLERDGEEIVIAVSSYGSNHCMNQSKAVRTDRYADDFLIEVYDAWEGACRFDGDCVTDCPRTPDPDCDLCGFDGVCARGCAKIDLDCPIAGLGGALCASADECESRLCIEGADDPRVSYCSTACDPSRPAAESCPAPLTVCAAEGDGAVCRFDGPSPSAQGAPCETGGDCRSGACDPDHDICIEQCGDGFPECPEPYVCQSFGSVSGCTVADDEGCAAGPAAAGARGRAGWWLVGAALAALAAATALRRRRRAS